MEKGLSFPPSSLSHVSFNARGFLAFCFCSFYTKMFSVLAPFNMEKAMTTHSSTLAWKIPWMEESGRLQSMGSRRVRHDLSDFTFTFHFHTFHWRRKRQPTPVFLPGETQGQRSLVGCCLWGRTELDTTEAT